jgi:uncharacterized protein
MKTPPKQPDYELRVHDGGLTLQRAEGETSAGTLRGYAAVFDQRSDPIYGVVEILKPGAFDAVLADDVVALIDHAGLPLARTSSGTLRLWVDATGLGYEFEVPDTERGRELAYHIERGDISRSSFAFRLESGGYQYHEEDDGTLVRTITNIARLRDVSPVTRAAYPQTSVDVQRSADDARGPGADDPAIHLARALRLRAEALAR